MTPEMAAEAVRDRILGPMRKIFQAPEHAELLDALNVLVDQAVPRLAQSIRERDEATRADTKAEMTAPWPTALPGVATLAPSPSVSPAERAVRAWVEPGPHPPYHDRMKARVRKIMPTLARALDEASKQR